ncbi:MAG: FHA domain-containing protein [Desulfovibrio sp.]|nr:FHA domain-containing protein [Desulfovibrio sp.]
MALIKICPSCGYSNPASEMMCQECAAFIADVAPIADDPPGKPGEAPSDGHATGKPRATDAAATIRAASRVSFCDAGGNIAFSAGDGEIIGRHNMGAEYLGPILTVSRRHCRLSQTAEGWKIEDLGSVNGTWINGRRICGPALLTDGDQVGLSQSCVLRAKL